MRPREKVGESDRERKKEKERERERCHESKLVDLKRENLRGESVRNCRQRDLCPNCRRIR